MHLRLAAGKAADTEAVLVADTAVADTVVADTAAADTAAADIVAVEPQAELKLQVE